MRNFKFLLVVLLAVAVTPWISIPASAHNTLSQTQGSTALERGYRTGYSDGYNSGFKDMTDRATRDYRSKDDYQRADRAYVEAWGPIEDYRDGYQQGYEGGYAAGFDRSPFDSSLPAGFKRRGSENTQGNSAGAGSNSADPGNSAGSNNSTEPADATQSNNSASTGGNVRIPSD